MIHYSCDRCKRMIDPAKEIRHVVRVEVQDDSGTAAHRRIGRRPRPPAGNRRTAAMRWTWTTRMRCRTTSPSNCGSTSARTAIASTCRIRWAWNPLERRFQLQLSVLLMSGSSCLASDDGFVAVPGGFGCWRGSSSVWFSYAGDMTAGATSRIPPANRPCPKATTR